MRLTWSQILHFKWGTEFDLEGWLKDYTLDQLWQMGRLGSSISSSGGSKNVARNGQCVCATMAFELQ